MLSPLKGLFRNRLFAISALFLALLTAAASGFFLTLFTVYGFTHKTDDDVQSKEFLTAAQPARSPDTYSQNMTTSERIALVSEAISAAGQSESVKSIDNRALVLGYCENLTPAYDKDMHKFKTDSLIHGAVFYNATYPNDMGMYESMLPAIEVREQIIDGVTYYAYYRFLRISKTLYKSSYQRTSLIAEKYLPSSKNGYDIKNLQAGDRFLFWGKFYKDTERVNSSLSNSFFSYGAPIYYNNTSVYPDYPNYPCLIKLPAGLTAEEYLATEEGKEKFGDVVEMFEKNIHSVPVVLTDSLMSMYNFSAGITPIKEGRAFTDEEYASGAQVCVISTALAKANDLKVGDRLEFQFYNRGKLYAEDTRLATDTEFYAPYFNGITPITDTMEYEIVGICKNDKFLFGEHDFTPNTVFIPSASMTDEAVRENLNADWEPMSTKLTSVIIEKGKLYEFREEMESLGYGDCFLYSDENGMTDVFLAAVERENHIKPIFCASAIVFAAVALICTVLAGVMIKRTDEYKEILAQSRAKAYFAAVLSTFTFSACALLLGVIASYFLFDTVAALLIGANTGVDFSLISALKALGLEAAVTAVGSAIGGIGGKK